MNAQPGTVEAVLEVARRNIGFIEGPNNDNPYAAVAGLPNHTAWCACFVCAVFKRAGVPLPLVTAYTPALARAFGGEGRYSAKPQVGDVMFLYFPSQGRIAHTGIVSVVEPGYVQTIEGNTDVAGGRTGGRVMAKRRALMHLTFGHPRYLEAKPVPAADPVLKRGDNGPRVKDVQRALVLAGFLKVPRGKTKDDVIDGDFGPATEAALQTFLLSKKVRAKTTTARAWAALRTIPGVHG